MSGEPCPHCGSADVDRGATGLDLCRVCGGLSRQGRPLGADDPEIRENELVATGALYAVLSGMAPATGRIEVVDGPDGIAVGNWIAIRIPGVLKSRYRVTVTMEPGA